MLVVSYASSLRVWLEQRRNITELEQQITSSQIAVASLRQQKLRWQDPAYVEIQAKQRLQWVLPGQIGYRIVGADAKSEVQDRLAGSGDTVAGPAPPWWAGAWGSVEKAGLRHRPGRSVPDRQPVRQIGPRHDIGPGRGGQGPDR